MMLTIGLIASIIVIIIVTLDLKKERKEEEVLALHLTAKEFNKSLDFMLMYGIINYTEYNRIKDKGLSYTKRASN